MIALLNVLIPVVVDRSISWKNGLMLEAFFYLFIFKYKCKGSVASIQFGFSNMFKSLSLRSWMLGSLLICASFDKFIFVIVVQNGNAKGSFLLFSIVNEFYEYYEARSAISLFLMDELFSHHFWCSKLEILYSRNVRKPIRFPGHYNKYVSIFLTST